MRKFIFTILILSHFVAVAQVHKGFTTKQLHSSQRVIYNKLGKYPNMFLPYSSQSERKVKLERVACSEGRVNLYFNAGLIQIGIREDICKLWEQQVRDTLGVKYADAKVGLFYNSIPIERYIPNAYRVNIKRDATRSSKPVVLPPLVKPLDELTYGKGLSYRTLAMWSSHGAYMDFNEDNRWKFQRPALFQTIEDIHTFYLLDTYLIPMLENAGAYIVTPKERDTNVKEIILDNDANEVLLKGNWTPLQGGFKKVGIIKDENPFMLGTSLISKGLASATYKTTLDSVGKYAVYVSYKRDENNSTKVKYTVHHKYGKSSFEVNQTIGGGWVYLGKFELDKDVEITLSGEGQLSTDAIKIGGGMGNVERDGKLSSMPRWAEAARYFMQYSGVDSDVYCKDEENDKKSDYVDDYKSRGDWVNYLKNKLKVPVDLAFTLHTNSGYNDSIFGSLAINYTNRGRDKYENGKSKFAGRDLADLVLTQVVDDIRALHDSSWVRRSLYDKSYAEISRPDVPAVILELLSHQNEKDMKYGLNKTFRFDVCRAIYKGILKFLADRYGYNYAVQPLPVNSLKSNVLDDKLVLKWIPTIDHLEATAMPDFYKVYRFENGAWDNGVRVEKPTLEITLPKNEVIFKIIAYNEGGKSFDIERAQFNPNSPNELSISRLPLIDYSVVGRQINFDKNSEFVDNDNPGFGASDLSTLFKGIVTTY